MKVRIVLSVVVIVCGFMKPIAARTSDQLRITLENGSKLIGRTLRSHDGRAIKAFMGIPYAKPPVGDLRFKVISDVLCYKK